MSPNPLSPAGSVALYEEDRDSQHHAHGQHDPDKGHVDRMLNRHGSEGTGRGVASVRTPHTAYPATPPTSIAHPVQHAHDETDRHADGEHSPDQTVCRVPGRSHHRRPTPVHGESNPGHDTRRRHRQEWI